MDKTIIDSILKSHKNLLKKKILVATSGGVDSVVLLHVLATNGFNVGVAHCNFKLRGEDSDTDEQFVRELSSKLASPFHTVSFNTRDYAACQKISIEMAARFLRYEWFNKIKDEFCYDVIATAHHQSDNAETLLLNLVRGTGLKGLLGIQDRDNLVRPLVNTPKTVINAYAKTNFLDFRTDKSNLQNIYSRNIVRNEVMPLLKQINPSVENSLHNDTKRFKQIFDFYSESVAVFLAKVVKETTDKQFAYIYDLVAMNHLELLLFEWLHPFGFNEDALSDICKQIKRNVTGKIYRSKRYKVSFERDRIVLSKIALPDDNVVVEELWQRVRYRESIVSLAVVDACTVEFTNPYRTFVDMATLSFPLTIRRWCKGDHFVPLGMTQNKKISDFLIDKKIGTSDKENVSVLVNSDGVIVWIIGLRLSNLFKIRAETIEIVEISLEKGNGL